MGGAATGTAARVGGSGALRSLGSRISGFLSSPTGAATGGFLAGDWLGADDGSILGGLWDSFSSAITPTTLIIGLIAVAGFYMLVMDDDTGPSVVVPGMGNGGGAG